MILGDTANTPYSTGTYASRSIVMAGGAVANACKALIPRFIIIGAHVMQAATGTVKYENGMIAGPQRAIPLREVAETWYLRPHQLPPDVDLGGLEATFAFKPKRDTGAFSYASHAAVVAVDTELGDVEILDYVIVEDCGTLVNPMVVDGQTLGGAAQGIGTAMYEESPFDPNGQPLASTFADYLLPGPTEMPAIRIFHMQTPSPYTEFGIKGMGEGGAIAPPAVIFNAVNDALTCPRGGARRDAADAAPPAGGARGGADEVRRGAAHEGRELRLRSTARRRRRARRLGAGTRLRQAAGGRTVARTDAQSAARASGPADRCVAARSAARRSKTAARLGVSAPAVTHARPGRPQACRAARR